MEEVQTSLSQGNAPVTKDEGAGQRDQMCTCLLETSLQAASLSDPISERIRGQFNGRSFSADEFVRGILKALSLSGRLPPVYVVQYDVDMRLEELSRDDS